MLEIYRRHFLSPPVDLARFYDLLSDLTVLSHALFGIGLLAAISNIKLNGKTRACVVMIAASLLSHVFLVFSGASTPAKYEDKIYLALKDSEIALDYERAATEALLESENAGMDLQWGVKIDTSALQIYTKLKSGGLDPGSVSLSGYGGENYKLFFRLGKSHRHYRSAIIIHFIATEDGVKLVELPPDPDHIPFGSYDWPIEEGVFFSSPIKGLISDQ